VSIDLHWWAFPAIVSALCVGYCFWPHEDSGGYFGGLDTLIRIFMAAIVAITSWAIGGVFFK